MWLNRLKWRRILLLAGVCLLIIVPVTAQPSAPSAAVLVDEASGVRYTVERFISANFPVGMVFTADGRLFYNEKMTGNVRVVAPDGTLQREPVISVAVDGAVERGLLGIALDPAYDENGVIWIVYTAVGTATAWPTNVIARFVEEDGVGRDLEILYDLPIETGQLIHNGGNIRFDDEGRLYWSVGDYNEPAHSQDLTTPQGAIHRFDVIDGELRPAAGNPFPDSSIYAYGFRNPFDIALDPVSGQVWTTENGPACDDQLNIALAGFNYGWGPDYACSGYDMIAGLRDYMPPVLNLTQSIGISGLAFYDHDAIPEWQNDLFFCDWSWGLLRRVEIDDSRSRVLDVHEMALGGEIDCRLTLAVSPDGALYFGTVGGGDGAIYRLQVVDESG